LIQAALSAQVDREKIDLDSKIGLKDLQKVDLGSFVGQGR